MKKLLLGLSFLVIAPLHGSVATATQPATVNEKSAAYEELLNEYFSENNPIARREILWQHQASRAQDRKLLKTDEELERSFDHAHLPFLSKQAASEIRSEKKAFMAEKRWQRNELQASIGPVAKKLTHIKQTIVFKYGLMNCEANVRTFSPRFAFLWGLSEEQIKEHQAWKCVDKEWVKDVEVQESLDAPARK